MVSELGLEPDVLPVAADHPASRHRFLYANGTLHRMPTGLGGLLRVVPPLSKPLLWSAVRDLLAPKGTEPDESIHSFTRRRFGAEVADLIADSLCRGVFAGDCRQLSVRSCFPALHRAERRRRSVIMGMATGGGGPNDPNDPNGPNDPSGPVPAVLVRSRCERWSQWALRGGLQTLPESIATFVRLRGADVRCNAELQRLRLRSDRTWQLTLPDSTITADHVISALPAAALARVLPPEFHPLAQELTHIPAVTVAVVNLQYRGVTLPVTGFGHLVPSCEDAALLGVVYDSVSFPQLDGAGSPSVRLTVMLGGSWFQPCFGDPSAAPKAELVQRAQRAVREQLGLMGNPERVMVRVQQSCIPQYTLGHWQRMERIRHFIEQQQLPLSLIGASYGGVSVNDCIASAKAAVGRLMGG